LSRSGRRRSGRRRSSSSSSSSSSLIVVGQVPGAGGQSCTEQFVLDCVALDDDGTVGPL
jgi:hypothetical protein